MISVLTLTYGRKQLLEEAIFSYLSQDFNNSEMVIINDEPNVVYSYDHPNIIIHNLPKRFENISKKLEWGFKQCKYDYIYRLDDDDLLSIDALCNVEKQINENPNYDIYRNISHFYFEHNKFLGVKNSVNTGNVYTKTYLDRVVFPNKNWGEDVDITFNFKGKIHDSKGTPTMIYRWGMNTFHISGMGNIEIKKQYDWTDKLKEKNQGVIDLSPNFNDNYYKQLHSYYGN